MKPNFNIDRPKLSEEEINKHKDFNKLLQQFKEQSIQKAKTDRSWWKNKKVRYSTVIAGATVVCTVTLFTIFKNQQIQQKETPSHETLTTLRKKENPVPPRKAFVASPSKKLAIPYSAYKINSKNGGEIVHSTSSKIKVPKNSFVDKNGVDVVGDITIEYREFHDKGDLIAGGIPMQYDSAGNKYNLETAGMFDIKGTQDGEPVFIKPGKTVKVELASATAEDRFNQYFLDTVKKNWVYVKRDHPIKPAGHYAGHQVKSPATEPASPKLKTLKQDVEVILPKKIDSVKTVYVNRVEKLVKPKEPAKPAKPSGKPTFRLDASSDEFPELAAFDNVIFEVGEENKNYTKEMSEITWSDVKVSEGPQKGKNYLLTLTSRQRVEKLIVYPVLSGKDFEKAQKMYEQKFSEYQGLAEKRKIAEQKLLAEMEAKQKNYQEELARKKADYEKERTRLLASMQSQQVNELASSFDNLATNVKATRIFEISRFGIHNSDCAKPFPDGTSLKPVFTLNEKSKPLFPDMIYLVDHTKNSVYSFYKASYQNISVDADAVNSFVIFVGDNVYLCDKTSFKTSLAQSSNKFLVTELGDKAENLMDFKKALEI